MLNKSESDRLKSPIYIILGSGGHTAEMCKINQALLKSRNADKLYQPIRYVVAKSDSTSPKKMIDAMECVGVAVHKADFIKVPRSREVKQNWITTVFTTLWAFLWSIWLVWRDKPRLILCNGPGTCVPFCIAAYLCRLVGRLSSKTKIVFVESFCRVRTLSLSGRLLMPLVDMLVVQWPALAQQYRHKNNVKYFGRLM